MGRFLNLAWAGVFFCLSLPNSVFADTVLVQFLAAEGEDGKPIFEVRYKEVDEIHFGSDPRDVLERHGFETETPFRVVSEPPALEEAEVFQSRLKAEGYQAELLVLPRSESPGADGEIPNLKKGLLEFYEPPTEQDMAIGGMMAAYTTLVALGTWVYTGVSVDKALTVAVLQAFVAFYTTVWIRTIDNLFAFRPKNREPGISSFWEDVSRFLFSGITTWSWRFFSGVEPRPLPWGEHWPGFRDVALNVGAVGLFSAIYSRIRNRELSRLASRWSNFNQYLIATPPILAHLADIKELPIYPGQTIPTLALIPAVYIGISLWVHFFHRTNEKIGLWEQRVYQRYLRPLMSVVTTGTRSVCGWVLSGGRGSQ